MYEQYAGSEFVISLRDDKLIEKAIFEEYIDTQYRFYEYGYWALEYKKEHKVIGKIGLESKEYNGEIQTELGYIVHPDYTRQGFAFWGCKKSVEFAREYLCLDKIHCSIKENNAKSINLAKKLGFVRDGENIIENEKYIRYTKILKE